MNFLHVFHTYSVKKIMFFVLIACIPGILTKCYFFGIGTIIQIFFAIAVSFILEIFILKIRLKNIKINAFDNSSIVTATLLGFSVPSSLPWWMMTIALFFSIIISKHLYGGIGQNIFNPAMVGYVILLLSFPLNMSDWNKKNCSISLIDDVKNSFNIIFLNKNIDKIQDLKLNIIPDAYTEATPLDFFKTQSHIGYNHKKENTAFKNEKIKIETSWKYINISFLISGLFLLIKKIVCWRIPFSFLTALGFFSSISYWYSKNLFASPLVHFLSGGTMICAFFIATDPVTTACTEKGKIIFGIMIGFLVWILRNYSDYPDGIAFSVLFANMTVPLMDNYIKKDGYGHGKV